MSNSKVMPRGVLLDLDGTLIDAFSPIIQAMRETLKAFNLPDMSDDAIRRNTGRGESSILALFGDRTEEALKHFTYIHDQTYLEAVKPLAGAEDLLSWFVAQGLPAGVVTSKGQHRAEAQLGKLGWLDYFACIIGKMEGRESKPSPIPLLLACDQMQVAVQDVIMIGDGEADMQAAKRAGCAAFGLTHSFSEHELKIQGADQCFQSLQEVLAWFKNQKN